MAWPPYTGHKEGQAAQWAQAQSPLRHGKRRIGTQLKIEWVDAGDNMAITLPYACIYTLYGMIEGEKKNDKQTDKPKIY